MRFWATFVHIYAKLGQENILRIHFPADKVFEVRALAVWGRARYLSVTGALHNIQSLRVSGEETLCFFETWMPERETSPRSQTFQAGRLNHYTRAPPNVALKE